jgi:uncharacterized membrane protein YtjA (UPF0391 family)
VSRRRPTAGRLALPFLGLERGTKLIVNSKSLSLHKERTMLHYAVVFFVIALIAALFGFGGIAAGAAGVAKILFFIFIVLAVAAFIVNAVRGKG